MSNARNIAALSTVEVGATADQTKADLNAIGVSGGRKNLIINGGFQISQRGTYTSATAYSGSGTYLLDRWKMTVTGSGSSATLQDLGGSVKLLAGSTFTGSTRAYQKLEDKGLYKLLSNKTVTFSAWVKSNTANARIEAWINAWVGFDQTHSGSGEWEKLSATYTFGDLTGHPDGNVNFQVGIDGFNSVDCAVTSGDYVEFKEVQLELGSVATDFEHRSYGEELQLCQRYYQILDFTRSHLGVLHRATGTTAGLPYTVFSLTATMRAYPSMTTSGTWATAVDQAGTPTLYETSYSSVTLRGNNGSIVAGGSQWLRGGFCNFDAEL